MNFFYTLTRNTKSGYFRGGGVGLEKWGGGWGK